MRFLHQLQPSCFYLIGFSPNTGCYLLHHLPFRVSASCPVLEWNMFINPFFIIFFYLLQPCYRNLMYHIYFAVFCCWGEVVVPSDDLSEIQRINKTAKHWTIIMMRVEPKHNTEQSSATCSSVKNSKYLFCSCFTVAGYFLISFSFMVRSYTCLFSFSNKLPFESKSLYM